MENCYYNLFLGENVACDFYITNARGNYKEILSMFKRKSCSDIRIMDKPYCKQADITLVLSSESQMNSWVNLLKKYFVVEKCKHSKEIKVY